MKREKNRFFPVILTIRRKLIVFMFISLNIILSIAQAAATDVFSEYFSDAGRKYNISPVLLRCIAETESSLNVNAIHRNDDRTYDVGIMQINSFWKDILKEKRWELTVKNPRYNILVGAWILANCVQRFGYTWQAVSCYHTGGRYFSTAYVKKVQECCFLKKGGKHAKTD